MLSLRLVVGAVGLGAVLALPAGSSAAEQALVLGHGTASVTLNANGALVGWGATSARHGDATESLTAGEIRYGDQILRLSKPKTTIQDKGEIAFTYEWPERGLMAIVHHRVTPAPGGYTWTREVEIRGPARLSADLTVIVENSLAGLPPDTWLPLVDGTGRELLTNSRPSYQFAGAVPQPPDKLLALPMVNVQDSKASRCFLLATDPFFSVLFTTNGFEWTYPARGGLENGCEKRTIVVSQLNGGPDEALERFFGTVLADVPSGPRWLHEIALVDYDYLSDGGQGWFHDIYALRGALSKGERKQALVCLHGWYDFLGRYCFNADTGKLDREWTSFSSYEAAKDKHPFGNIGGDQVPMGFGNCKPVKMSLTAVHERLRYARERGFRVAMYFADGVNAGEGLPDFEPSRVLRWGGWQGPDSKGRSYFQNPLDPKVRAFFLDYTRALLDEFGPEIDALNWDETFHIAPGELGTESFPGYADRAMMRLVREVSAVVEEYNRQRHRQIALLTSDCLGAFGTELKAPYALMAQGTYQDSWCQPKAWSYGVFANYRNVVWSCCWWPVSKWAWVDFGVRQYQAPVSLSNGWGDDTGFSEMTAEQRARALALFQWRKQHRTKLRWFEQLPRF